MRKEVTKSRIELAAVQAIVFMAICAFLAFSYGERKGIERLQLDADHRLDLFASAIEGIVKPAENVPATIQLHPAILELLRESITPTRVSAANTYLRRLNAHVGSLAAFTLNNRGVVVASSNQDHPDDSRVGTDVSFRPYFLEALSGRVGRHFSIGIEGRSAGYFVSYPIRDGALIVGVAVIKISLQPIGQMWHMVGAPALITDANFVVISSSQPEWQYRSLIPLTVEQRVDHQLTQLYADVPILELPSTQQINPDLSVQVINDQLVLMRPLNGMNWRVMLFLDLGKVHQSAAMFAAMAAVGAAFLTLVVIVIFQAKRIVRQRRDARRMLESAYAQLETKVHERTQDLTDANERLTREVGDREQAEQSLRAAQDELVQAAKMAVLGQMAAGITHELTQPIGAVQTLAENAEEFLVRGQSEPVAGNLQIIGRLAGQMGNIIQPLKTFARKSDSVSQSTDVGQTIGNALFLYGLRLNRIKAHVTSSAKPCEIFAWCDANRLEQVLINLIGNALDAMESVDRPHLELQAYYQRDEKSAQRWVCIDVMDNGAGISPEVRARLFEPFFTTKEKGAGLGLGLVISRDIVNGFGGEILVFGRSTTGTCFRIKIPADQPI